MYKKQGTISSILNSVANSQAQRFSSTTNGAIM